MDEIALLASRYMHEYGMTRDHFTNVALACRRHAGNNSQACMYGIKLTREQYANPRWISQPLCLFDNCLESDGAVAAADRARDCRQRPVYVHASAQGTGPQTHSMVNYFAPDPMAVAAEACAQALYSRSEFKAEDIDVAQLYDSFTPLVLRALESYGICGLSEDYIHSFNQVEDARSCLVLTPE